MPESDEWYRDMVFQEDNLFTNRLNLLLVSESMLIVAFMTSVQLSLKFVGTILSFLGLIITISFTLIFYRNIGHIKNLKEKWKTIDSYYKEMRASKKSGYANFFLGIILPTAIIIVWLLFILYSLGYLSF